MEIRANQDFIFGCENKIQLGRTGKPAPSACRSSPRGQRSAGRPNSGLSTASAVFGLRDSPPLPRHSTEDPAAVIVTAEDVRPIGSFAPHRGVSIAGRRRRPAEGDF